LRIRLIAQTSFSSTRIELSEVQIRSSFNLQVKSNIPLLLQQHTASSNRQFMSHHLYLELKSCIPPKHIHISSPHYHPFPNPTYLIARRFQYDSLGTYLLRRACTKDIFVKGWSVPSTGGLLRSLGMMNSKLAACELDTSVKVIRILRLGIQGSE